MQLTLTTDQANQVLHALAQQPYIQVHELIQHIQQQAQQQMQPNADAEEAQTQSLTKSS